MNRSRVWARTGVSEHEPRDPPARGGGEFDRRARSRLPARSSSASSRSHPRRCQAPPADAVPPPPLTVLVVNLAVLFHHLRAPTGGSPTAPRRPPVGAGAGQPHRGGAHPPAGGAQPPLRTGRPWVADVAAVGPVERLQGAPRRRPPRRLRDRGDGVAVRLHRRRVRDPRPPSGESSRRRRSCCASGSSPAGGRDGVRHPTGARPGPQRVRAVAPMGRLDGDRAVLGADRPPRPPTGAATTSRAGGDRVGLARVGPGDPDGERRVAVAAAATRSDHRASARRRTSRSSTWTTACGRRSRRPSASAAARCASGTRSPP